MSIFIDKRVGSRDLKDHAALCDISKLVSIDAGDACFVGNGPDGKTLIGVEVKTVDDYLSSLSSGRLQGIGGQLDKMSRCYSPFMFLVIYGRVRSFNGKMQVWQPWRAADSAGEKWGYHKLDDKPISYSYWSNSLVQISIRSIIHCVTLDNKDQVAWWIRCTWQGFNKLWNSHKLFRKMNTSADVRTKSLWEFLDDDSMTSIERDRFIVRVKVASQLKGISFERALCVAKHFRTVEDMVCADVDDWMKIDKVGKVIAESAVKQCQM